MTTNSSKQPKKQPARTIVLEEGDTELAALKEELAIEAANIDYVVPETTQGLRDYILNVPDLEDYVVTIPAWRTRILIRTLTADERYTIYQRHTDMKTGVPVMKNVYADMFIASARHPTTEELMFVVQNRADILKKAGGVIDQISTLITTLSGITAQSKRELEKN